ncbi:MAG: RNA-binding S4 domain-containing protein [Hyphomicrobium sp.]
MNPKEPGDQATSGTQRLDKWLWFARFVKTRTLATELVAAGKVRVNRAKVDKPAQTVRPGDVLTIAIKRTVQLVRVVGIAERRGPAVAAQALYEQLTAEGDAIKPQAASPPEASSQPPKVGAATRTAGSGRPTKKERRAIDRLGGKSG